MRIEFTQCCGVNEIDYLGLHDTSEEAMEAFKQSRGHAPIILFTGVTKRKMHDHTGVGREDDYGQAFARLIRRDGLGHVTASRAVRNPESGNHIRAWVWTVDRTALQNWPSKKPKAKRGVKL